MKRAKLILLELILISAATIFAVLLRENFELSTTRFESALPYIGVTVAVAAVVFPLSGVTWSVWRVSALHDYIMLSLATVVTIAISAALFFAFNGTGAIARSVPVLQAMSMIFLLIGARLFVRIRHSMRARPLQLAAGSRDSEKTVILFGTTRLAELYLRAAADLAAGQVRVVGILARQSAKVGRTLMGCEILGTALQMSKVCNDLETHGVEVSEICVAVPFSELDAAERAELERIENGTGIRITYLNEALFDAGRERYWQSNTVEDRSAFALIDEQLDVLRNSSYWRWKRRFDVVLAASAIAILSPLMIVVGLLVALDVGLPIVFWQVRPGVGGRPFRLYKFRTMGASHGPDGKRRSDEERLSSFGRFVRQTRFDELPQLYNILVGHMSFVGPRPLLPKDQPVGALTRTLIRPGLTGWAQVNGGRDVSSADKVALDVWYILNANFRLDAEIAIKTIWMLVAGECVNERAAADAWMKLKSMGVTLPRQTSFSN